MDSSINGSANLGDAKAMLALAGDLALRAAETIRTIRARGFAVARKADNSPVTEADRQSERLITAGLRAAFPQIPVIAEEEVAQHTAPESVGSIFWLVDPLDGTREFAAGRDEFAVNVGLVRGCHPWLGAVALPATHELYLGIVGVGAWRRDANADQEPIQTRLPPEAGLTVMASRHYRDDPRIAQFLKGKKIASLINIGSAMKFCRLAEGKADLYPRLGRTMEWDTAAPQAVLEAAGGHIVTFDGAPLLYAKPNWENPSFVCTGR